MSTSKTTYDLTLLGFGDQKINVIKEVRAITGLGLLEAKNLVEGVPSPIQLGLPKAKAENVKRQLEDAGASAELKKNGTAPARLQLVGSDTAKSAPRSPRRKKAKPRAGDAPKVTKPEPNAAETPATGDKGIYRLLLDVRAAEGAAILADRATKGRLDDEELTAALERAQTTHQELRRRLMLTPAASLHACISKWSGYWGEYRDWDEEQRLLIADLSRVQAAFAGDAESA